METANQSILNNNKKLKKLLHTKLRPPSKLCLDITLIVLLLGMVGVVIAMVVWDDKNPHIFPSRIHNKASIKINIYFLSHFD